MPRTLGDAGPDGDEETDEVDIALVAFLEDGDWALEDLPDDALTSVDTIAARLRRYPGDDGAIGLLSVGEAFFLVVRVGQSAGASAGAGADLRLLCSDASVASDWALARSAVARLGVPVVDDDEPAPAGDLGILSDHGIPAREMGELIDEHELYPDEQLSDIAARLGFGDLFDDLADLADA